MTGYINLSDFLLDRLKSLSNTRISLDLFEDSILKSDLYSQEEFNKSMKFLLDSDKIEYKVDKNGIYVEIKNRGHSPSENSIPYATSDSGGWSTISNLRWYTSGSVSTNWDLTDGQLIVGSEPRYKFILNVPTMSIEVPENSERISIRSLEYTRNIDIPRVFYSTTFEPRSYYDPVETVSGSFKIRLPLDDTDSIKFLISRTDGNINLLRFLVKFESEQYKCQLESWEYCRNPENHQREYKFIFSGSRIQ